MSLDYDKFCHCIICGTNLRREKVIDGKVETIISSLYDTIKYRMNDKSLMPVCVCKMCKPTVTKDHEPMIMEKVYKGWMMEIEESKTPWPEEKKREYQDRYSKLQIIKKER